MSYYGASMSTFKVGQLITVIGEPKLHVTRPFTATVLRVYDEGVAARSWANNKELLILNEEIGNEEKSKRTATYR